LRLNYAAFLGASPNAWPSAITGAAHTFFLEAPAFALAWKIPQDAPLAPGKDAGSSEDSRIRFQGRLETGQISVAAEKLEGVLHLGGLPEFFAVEDAAVTPLPPDHEAVSDIRLPFR
jgi:hypothetical protein